MQGMDFKQQVKQAYDLDQITQLLVELGSSHPLPDGHGNFIFQTICHNPNGGGKHKLYYYPESRSFYCYSECGALDVFQLVMNVLGWEFKETLNWLAKRVGLSSHAPIRGLLRLNQEESELGWVEPVLTPKPLPALPIYDSNVLTLFTPCYPKSWYLEGISPETAEVFDLRFDFDQNKAIIPYKNQEGQLIGIRGRSFNGWEEAAGYKYMPVKKNGIYYRHPIQLSLYGIYEHQAHIKQFKQVVLFEGEKSVMIHHSWYPTTSTALGLGGIHLSQSQCQCLLDLGVEKVLIGIDHDFYFQTSPSTETERNQAKLYLKRLKRLVRQLLPYVQVEVLLDLTDSLPLKASPTDNGKEHYETLVKNRWSITDESLLDELEIAWFLQPKPNE